MPKNKCALITDKPRGTKWKVPFFNGQFSRMKMDMSC